MGKLDLLLGALRAGLMPWGMISHVMNNNKGKHVFSWEKRHLAEQMQSLQRQHFDGLNSKSLEHVAKFMLAFGHITGVNERINNSCAKYWNIWQSRF